MTDWCRCNMLWEAQEKAAKWDAIVRCWECVHFRPRNADKNEPSRCTGVFAYVNPDPDGFCKWGRRDA